MQRRQHMDASALFVRLPVEHIDRLAFDTTSCEQLVEMGYTRTCEVLQTSVLHALRVP
jgi:hypothetical protein